MYQLGQVLKIQYATFVHYGIFVGDDSVIHNSKAAGRVEQVSIENFADGKPINVSSIKPENAALAVQNAKKYLGLPYSLLAENCEHFVRTVCGLMKESVQVQKYLISAVGIGALIKSDSAVLKFAGGAATLAALLTPSEKSPVKNAAIAGCLAAGVAYLAS